MNHQIMMSYEIGMIILELIYVVYFSCTTNMKTLNAFNYNIKESDSNYFIWEHFWDNKTILFWERNQWEIVGY